MYCSEMTIFFFFFAFPCGVDQNLGESSMGLFLVEATCDIQVVDGLILRVLSGFLHILGTLVGMTGKLGSTDTVTQSYRWPLQHSRVVRSLPRQPKTFRENVPEEYGSCHFLKTWV
jgi:hypothetical protein